MKIVKLFLSLIVAFLASYANAALKIDINQGNVASSDSKIIAVYID